MDGKNILDGLAIVGTENVSLKFEDLKEKKLGVTPKLELYVNKVTPL